MIDIKERYEKSLRAAADNTESVKLQRDSEIFKLKQTLDKIRFDNHAIMNLNTEGKLSNQQTIHVVQEFKSEIKDR